MSPRLHIRLPGSFAVACDRTVLNPPGAPVDREEIECKDMQLGLILGHEEDAIGTGLAQPGTNAERGAAGQCLRPEQRDIDAALRIAGGDELEGTNTALA